MFTGLVEQLGTVVFKKKRANNCVLQIKPDNMWTDVSPGESIAVNGVCLTVTVFNDSSFSADISLPSLNDTDLGALQVGANVHLERALKMGDRLGGHLVQGHVDEVGKIRNIIYEKDNVFLEINASVNVIAHLIHKCSVCVSGVSLTVQFIGVDYFRVVLLPHTFSKTIFNSMKPLELVNIELDLLAKYVKSFSNISFESKVSESFLRDNGF